MYYKVLIIALLPFVPLLWIVLGLTYGFLPATIMLLSVFAIVALEVWWIKFCVDHFTD